MSLAFKVQVCKVEWKQNRQRALSLQARNFSHSMFPDKNFSRVMFILFGISAENAVIWILWHRNRRERRNFDQVGTYHLLSDDVRCNVFDNGRHCGMEDKSPNYLPIVMLFICRYLQYYTVKCAWLMTYLLLFVCCGMRLVFTALVTKCFFLQLLFYNTTRRFWFGASFGNYIYF